MIGTRQANHHRLPAAGDCADQPHNRVFERHRTKTTIDVTDLIWKRARMAGFSLFAQSPDTIETAWRNILPLIAGGFVKPVVDRVYPFGEAGEALRHLIEDRPFGKVVLAGSSE